MLTILTITALQLSSQLYAYSSPEEVFSMPTTIDEQKAWQEISTEPELEGETLTPSQQQNSSSHERIFYKYGEVKTISPVPAQAEVSTSPESSFPTQDDEFSDIVIAEPVSDTPVSEPEPLPLSEEELLVPNIPAPAIVPKSGWKIPSVPMPLLLLGGVVLLGMIAYWIWRIIPRFKTTMSKEAVSPTPVDLKTIDANQMARLKTALGEEEK